MTMPAPNFDQDALPEGYPSAPELAAGTPLVELASAGQDDAPPPEKVKLPGHAVRVWLEVPGQQDLEVVEVRLDNRDYIRWDKTAPRHKWDAGTHRFIFQTFLAWAAMVRQGLDRGLNFDQFQALAVEVEDLKVEPARPTQ